MIENNEYFDIAVRDLAATPMEARVIAASILAVAVEINKAQQAMYARIDFERFRREMMDVLNKLVAKINILHR